MENLRFNRPPYFDTHFTGKFGYPQLRKDDPSNHQLANVDSYGRVSTLTDPDFLNLRPPLSA